MNGASEAEAADFRRAVLHAIEVGAEAEEMVRLFADPTDHSETGVGIGGLQARFRRWTTGGPGPDQARRSGEQLEEYARALTGLTDRIDDDELQASVGLAGGWSKRLWDSNANAPAIYTEVRASLARLHQYRVNLTLGHPPTRPDHVRREMSGLIQNQSGQG